MGGIPQDLAYALRLFRRQPAFALFVVAMLAVGIGATTAAFTVLEGVLLRPLPYPDSDRLVNVWGRFDPESGFDFPQFPLSPPEFVDYRAATHALADVAAFSQSSVTLAAPGGDPERLSAAGVTPNLFGLLGVRPALGRTFTPDEAKPGAPSAILISHGLWQSRFGGDAGVVGRTVTMNGEPATIVGVMPPGFAYPRATVRIWGALAIDPASPGNRKAHMIRAVGRLAPGQTLASARAELQSLMADWRARFPDVHTGHYLFLRPMIEDVAGSVRPALLTLMAATAFVFLIVCANVASILLARGESRTREMAIRGALGAKAARLLRLSLVESAVLACSGAALGLLLAYTGVRALVAIDPASVPRAEEIGVDLRVVLFAASAAAIATLTFGVLPALRGATPDLNATLRASSTTATSGGRQWFRASLVVVEVALGVVLVLGAALMLRSFSRLLAVEPGFRPDGLISAAVSLPESSYEDAGRVDAFYAQLLERLRSTPGILSASAGTTVPLWSGRGVWDFDIEGKAQPGPGQPAWNAAATIVRHGYFETLGIPLVAGRSFTSEDGPRTQPVVIVNASLAKKFFPGEDPIGRRLRIAGSQDPPNAWMTVVGVAGDMRADDLATPAAPAYYFLQSQAPDTTRSPVRAMAVFARTAGDPAPVMSTIRTAVRELDASLAVYDVQTSTSVIQQSVARPRFTATLLSIFALIGVLLGASGIYGVLAYTVARRTQEIGIRRALGAPAVRLGAEVMSGGLRPVLAGLALGLVGSYWLARWWSSQLFEISPTDPSVYAAAAVGVLLVALAATIVPVRRALRISALEALRS